MIINVYNLKVGIVSTQYKYKCYIRNYMRHKQFRNVHVHTKVLIAKGNVIKVTS